MVPSTPQINFPREIMVSRRLGAPAAAGAAAPALGELDMPVGAVVAQPASAATESVDASSTELHLYIGVLLTYQSKRTKWDIISNKEGSRMIPETSKNLLS